MNINELVTGKKIRELRIAHNMTQKELAEKVGLTQQAINLIEHEKRKVDIKLYIKIANILDPNHKELIYLPSFPDDINESWIKLTNMKKQASHTSEELITTILEALKDIIIENNENNIFTEIPEENLLYYFWFLNEKGQKKIIEYTADLVGNPEYCKIDKYRTS